MKCALVVGHRENSPGAENKRLGITEFGFNKELAERVVELCRVDVEIVYRDRYKDLPEKVNAINPNFIVSLHCNAFNTVASGTETLYYHRSVASSRLGWIVQKKLVDALDLPDRGLKPKRSEDRGGFLLRYTNAPCVIAEPFFIDNISDVRRAHKRYPKLVHAYATAIEEAAEVC